MMMTMMPMMTPKGAGVFLSLFCLDIYCQALSDQGSCWWIEAKTKGEKNVENGYLMGAIFMYGTDFFGIFWAVLGLLESGSLGGSLDSKDL